jgi:hypothetical protein
VRRLVADRRSAEAHRFYEAVARVAHARVGEHEDTLAAALLELMTGGLATFGGTTLPDLVAHIQATVDRTARRDPTAASEPTPPALMSDLDLALSADPPERPRGHTAIHLRSVRLAITAPGGATEGTRTQSAKVARHG